MAVMDMKTMKGDKLTPAIEDYLKAIYALSSQNNRVKTTEIAEALNVKPASVTGMVQKMANNDPPLVDYRKHYGVRLTPEGEHIALQTLRNHRLLEKFLHETMGFPWDEVHEEAQKLEHVISPAFEKRMASVLENPLYDPHGAPIPTPELKMPLHSTQSLGDLCVGQTAVVQRVPDDDPELLRYLEDMGIIPGARIEIIEHSAFDHNLKMRVAGRDEPVVLGPSITGQVFVESDETLD
jgi:DtxR family Mn-dependent transcriptional regulator